MDCFWGEGNAYDGGRDSGTSNRTLCYPLSLDSVPVAPAIARVNGLLLG